MPYEQTLDAFRRGDNGEAKRLARLDLDAAVSAGDSADEVAALCMLARVALREDDFDVVEEHAARAHEVALAAGEQTLERMPVHLLAVAARMTGRLSEGRVLYVRSMDLAEQAGEARLAALEHRNLAYLELRAGDIARGRELIVESQRRFANLDTTGLEPYLAFDEATVAFLDGDLDTATTKLAEADRQFNAAGVVPDPDDAVEIVRLRQHLQDAARPSQTGD